MIRFHPLSLPCLASPCLALPCFAFPRASGSLPPSKRLPLPSAKEGNESETVQRCSHPTLCFSLSFGPSRGLSSLLLHPVSFASSYSLPRRVSLACSDSYSPSLFLPPVCQPSSCHPSNFSTSFTKIKINSSTTCPGTPPGTPPPSSAAASLEP